MSAEVQRALVATTATTIAAQLAQVTAQLIERIAALEKANYENVGKSGASPDLTTLVTDLVNTKNVNKGKTISLSPIIGLLYAVGGGFILYLLQLFIK